MAVTVSGTSITFNDASVQTTAATAPTTATVLAATAGAALGAVGSYAMLSRPNFSGAGINPNTNIAGSSLRYAGGGAAYWGTSHPYSVSGTAPAGTWKCLGFAGNSSGSYGADEYATLFLRIS